MARLRNTTTKVVVNVDDETAARLGGGWEPVDQPKKQAPRRRKADTDASDDE